MPIRTTFMVSWPTDVLERLKAWAAAIKRETLVLWFACRDPRTPWYAKTLAVLIVAYALSPIDLIPDFIPVLGLLDELILLPGALWVALHLVPTHVLIDARARERAWSEAHRIRPRNWIAGGFIVALWALLAWLAWRWLVRPRI